MRDAPQPKSIEVLAAEVRDQLAAQRSYVETLEAKAGAVLGFAGLLIVLAPGRGGIWIEMSRLAGVVSARSRCSRTCRGITVSWICARFGRRT